MTVFFYISGHGFGHAVRQIAIINALATSRPRCGSSCAPRRPAWLFDAHRPPARSSCCRARPTPAWSRSTACTPTSAKRSCGRARSTSDSLTRVAREAALLRAAGCRPRRRRCAAAGLCRGRRLPAFPSVVCANFTWDWIYRDYREQPGVDELVAADRRGLRPRGRRMAAADARRLRDLPAIVDMPSRRAARRAAGDRALRAGAARPAAGTAAGAGLVRRLRPRVSCRSTVSTACATGTSSCRRPANEPLALPAGVHDVRGGRDLRTRPALRGSGRRRRRRDHQAGLRHHLGLRGQRHGACSTRRADGLRNTT